MERPQELVKQLNDIRNECWGVEAELRMKLLEFQELLDKVTKLADLVDKLKIKLD